jgi:uncharacterized membrane protein
MRKPTDQELDITIAGMLRFGVTLAAMMVLAGGIMYLLHPFSRVPDYGHFVAADASLRTVSGIFRGLIELKSKSVIQFGLLVLIGTPVARVVFCVVGFARQHNHLYVMVSFIVLLILIYSLTEGGSYQ